MSLKNAREILKKHFNFSDFRPSQKDIINSVVSRKDTLVVMPTGSGKSLCYQVPALMLPGVTLVVSPLIALMKDQVESLEKLAISATFINSTLSYHETESRIRDVRDGKYKLIYIAPERFHVSSFSKLISQIEVSLVAVDEAHCISQWGHDFRPSYLKLRKVIESLGNPTVIALTATATVDVQKDILSQLGLMNPHVYITGFDRPNLKYFAIDMSEDQKKRELIRIALSVKGSGIVYVSTKKGVQEVSLLLKENHISCAGYHGGMEKKSRDSAQNQWLSGQTRVIVATNAFGMGIDKADVRFVIHYNMPGSMEAYYQEAGRAGRDGKTSYCLLFYSYKDRKIQEFLINNGFPSEEVLKKIYDYLFSLDKKQILLTYTEIGSAIKCNDLQIGSAVLLFERHGILKRMARQVLHFRFEILEDYQTASKKIKRAPLQKKVLEWLSNRSDDYTPLQDPLSELDITADQFSHTMRELASKNILLYIPPFRGRGIELTSSKTPWSKIAIDFAAYDTQRTRQLDRINDVESYVHGFHCRRKYILGYFGEEYQNDKCGGCDYCLDWQSPESESVDKSRHDHNDFSLILGCIEEFDGKFGVTTFSSILKGIDEDRFRDKKIDRSPFFGALMEKNEKTIIKLIYSALQKGFLAKSAGNYPVLELTELGYRHLFKSDGKK
ncbi:MAG: ATP-dependent DNA helicase RecQ [Calditrichaceae bacterium]